MNGESVLKKRPLYNNSQIAIPNNVQFRWIHSQDTAETRGKIILAKLRCRGLFPYEFRLLSNFPESEFPPWSDPGKKVREFFNYVFHLSIKNIFFSIRLKANRDGLRRRDVLQRTHFIYFLLIKMTTHSRTVKIMACTRSLMKITKMVSWPQYPLLRPHQMPASWTHQWQKRHFKTTKITPYHRTIYPC